MYKINTKFGMQNALNKEQMNKLITHKITAREIKLSKGYSALQLHVFQC